MAYERIKTEMHGDTSRWMRRADAKRAASRLRRVADSKAARDGERDAGLRDSPRRLNRGS
ncbi:MAG TPA: hypothetical protein VNW92_17870 [Polyangiaceae bacterium]|jgi:hypothetical protein|nr:hypothetical protein [Polyangiaceae bacterium]